MGNGVGWLGLVGVGLIVLGLTLLVLVDAPRRLLRLVTGHRVSRTVGAVSPEANEGRHDDSLPEDARPVEPLWAVPTTLHDFAASEPPPFVRSTVGDRG